MMIFAIGLLIIGVLARFIPHWPNFTPIVALALFGGCYLKKPHALWLPLLLMVVSDFFLGFHSTIFFTWSSVLLVAGLGMILQNRKTPLTIMGFGFLSALLFFLITNFGAWLVMYPLTYKGLIQCYTLAIPFFRMELLSTFVYTFVLFASYETFARFFDRRVEVKIKK